MEIPTQLNRLMVHKLSTNFRECTKAASVPFSLQSLRGTQMLVRNFFAGINASDINFTAGAYKPGVQPPFEAGFEAIGRVVAIGDKVQGFKVGDAVITQAFGAFADYQIVSNRNARVVPRVDPRLLPLEISGTTASIALETQAQPKEGETALVTAAAGGTGIFAVQLLKHQYKCKVIGTCSSDEKADLLRRLGCDRVINYKREDVHEVLQKEYPHGVNVVYESVGGRMLDAALMNLAVKGRLVTIGSITGYADGTSFGSARQPQLPVPIGTLLLQRSASIKGFFLPHFGKFVPQHFERLRQMLDAGTLQSVIDPKPFVGLESVADAVEYLHSGMNTGKIVVQLADVPASKL